MMRLGEKQKKFICERIARFVTRSKILEESIREFLLDVVVEKYANVTNQAELEAIVKAVLAENDAEIKDRIREIIPPPI